MKKLKEKIFILDVVPYDQQVLVAVDSTIEDVCKFFKSDKRINKDDKKDFCDYFEKMEKEKIDENFIFHLVPYPHVQIQNKKGDSTCPIRRLYGHDFTY